MAKKAITPAPEAPEKVSEEVIISTVSETPETEVTASSAIDQPAVSDDESASSSPAEPTETEAPSSPAEPAIVEPEVPAVVEEPVKAGGGFEHSPFVESKPAPTMIERITALEARVAVLEGK